MIKTSARKLTVKIFQLNEEEFQISWGQFSVHLLVMTCDALSMRIMRKSFRSIALLDEKIDGGVTEKRVFMKRNLVNHV